MITDDELSRRIAEFLEPTKPTYFGVHPDMIHDADMTVMLLKKILQANVDIEGYKADIRIVFWDRQEPITKPIEELGRAVAEAFAKVNGLI